MDELSDAFNRWLDTRSSSMPDDVPLEEHLKAWRDSFQYLRSPEAHLSTLCDILTEREALFGSTDPSLYGQVILLIHAKTKGMLTPPQRQRMWHEAQSGIKDPLTFDAPRSAETLYKELFPDAYMRWRAG